MEEVKGKIKKKDVECIIRCFGIDTKRSQKIKIPSLLETTKIFKVEGFGHPAYIISTPAAKEVACFPSIVGADLAVRCAQTAEETVKAISHLRPLKENIILAHILRAGPGYEVASVLKEHGARTTEIFVRPRYKEKSFRAHNGQAPRELEIVYEDFSQLDRIAGEKATLIKPDTEASGKTSTVVLERIFSECAKRKINISELILYGFISERALSVIENIAIKNKIRISSFAIGNITALAQNNYDMPIYGIDESYYTSHGAVKNLGCITDEEILIDYLSCYFPGMDQPGDFSARQEVLFTGDGVQRGEIGAHLQNSLNLLLRLKAISEREQWYKGWHSDIAEMHIELLKSALNKHAKNPQI